VEPTRRKIVQLGMPFVAACAVLPLMVMKAKADDACTDAASEGLRSSLHYTAAAPEPTQACSGCAFFSRGDAHQPCGKCVILDGPVNPNGHCDSSSKKN